MSVEEFIVKHYVWILVVLAILIVTIIGFIADKKSKKKKEGMNMNEQNINNQMMSNPDVMPNMNMATTPVQPQDVNQNMNVAMPNIPDINTNMQMPNVEVPTMSNQSSMVSEEFNYTPLSEQTPNIPPRFEGMPTNSNLGVNTQTNPAPTVEVPNMNMAFNSFGPMPTTDNIVPQQPQNMNMAPPVQPTMQVDSVQPIYEQPTLVQPQPINVQPINPEPIPLTQPMPNQNINMNIPNMNMAMPNMNVNPMPQSMQTPMNNATDVNNMFVTGNPNNVPTMDNNNNNPW